MFPACAIANNPHCLLSSGQAREGPSLGLLCSCRMVHKPFESQIQEHCGWREGWRTQNRLGKKRLMLGCFRREWWVWRPCCVVLLKRKLLPSLAAHCSVWNRACCCKGMLVLDVLCIPLYMQADKKPCVALRSTRVRQGGFGIELINVTQVCLEESEKTECSETSFV